MQDYRLSDSLPFSPAPWIHGRKIARIFKMLLQSSSCEHDSDFTHGAYLSNISDYKNGFHWLTMSHNLPWKRCHSVRRLGGTLLCHVNVDQLASTKNKYPRFVGFRYMFYIEVVGSLFALYLVSYNQEIKEDNANTSRVGAELFVSLTFRTLVILYQLVFRILAQVDEHARI